MKPTPVNGHMVYHMVPGPEEYNLNGSPPPEYTNSILNDVKRYCNLMEDFTSFDQDIIDMINGVLGILIQLGIVSPSAPLVQDDSLPWAAWIPDEARFGMVKMYVKAKVKLIFDPPTGSHLDALQQLIDECEWRGFFEADTELY